MTGTPACAACGKEQIYEHARIRRAAVRVGICREPYVLNLCEPHMAQLLGILPKGGLWVLKRYQPGAAD
jgi:hypothetical protein